MAKNIHTGSSFDDFLIENNMLEDCTAAALKFVLAEEMQKKIQKQSLSKSEVARILKTSRTGLMRLLDPEIKSITLQTLSKMANFVGKRIEVKLADA